MVTVIPRSAWGARHEDGFGSAPLPAREVWFHHSATLMPDVQWIDADRDGVDDDEEAAMRQLESIGEQRFGRGISYTWAIPPSGRVYEGHGVARQGAHTGGRNSIARAIVLIGNYDTHQPTAAQIESAAQLLVQEHRAGHLVTARLNGGHQQAPGASTACPGRYGMAVIGQINARAAAILDGAPIQKDEDMAVADLERDEAIRHETVTGELVQTKGIATSIDQKVDRLLALMATDAETDRRLEETITRALQNTGAKVDVRELASEILRQLAAPAPSA